MDASIQTHSVSTSGIAYIANKPRHGGDTILACLHGWSCRASDYTRLFEALDTNTIGLRAVAVDLPGHGDTAKEVAEADVSAFASAVLTLLTELTSDAGPRVVLVGHSMSCRIALETWAQARRRGVAARIKGLVFLDGSNFGLKPSLTSFDREDPRRPTLSPEEIRRHGTAMFDSMFSAATPDGFREATIESILSRDTGYSVTLRRSYLDYDFTKSDGALREFSEGCGRLLILQSTTLETNRGRVPMKAGETSSFMRYIKERVPGSTQSVIPDSAHFPHVDYPDIVARTILDFLQV